MLNYGENVLDVIKWRNIWITAVRAWRKNIMNFLIVQLMLYFFLQLMLYKLMPYLKNNDNDG